MIYPKDIHIREIQDLSLPLTRLKGVGPGRAERMARKGLHTVLDLFYFIPIRYEDRTRISPIKDLQEGIPALVKGKILYGREERFFKSRKRLFRIKIEDEDDELELLWFHYRRSHLIGFVKPGAELMAYGVIKKSRGLKQIFHPDITMLSDRRPEDMLGIFPVYSSIEGISGNLLRRLIKTSLNQYLDSIVDPIPANIINSLDLPDLASAIEDVHFPPKESSMDQLKQFSTHSHKRLIFDRFFYAILTMTFRKISRERVSKSIYLIPKDLVNEMRKIFKFSLTSHQIKTVKEIKIDLTSGRPMNRLLMGDVGAGKTVVAAIAAYIAVQNNQQAALMTPTQVLADQHMRYFSALPQELGFRCVILTGDLKRAEREDVYGGIKSGRYNLIIGTHSLIQKRLTFSDLGLAIIDEQHRFGVRQRALMDRKGNNPHILVMSATPIPRTLAITLYADMDVSIIKEYPEGHIPVATYLVEEQQKRQVFETLRQRMSAGQQAFVICPVIEESEEQDLKSAREMAERLRKILSPPFQIGVIHGRLSTDEKDKVMSAFHKGEIDLLVGTTVIEVGIDVSNATVMVIEHPERFGLAQLHQLRGRIGRGSKGGVCFLMLSRDLSEKAIARLKTLAETHDGFEIARKDLELRGHGELTGTRQSGAGEIDISEMITYQHLLVSAKKQAKDLIESDPELSRNDHHLLRTIIASILKKPLDV
jgi:ATP-dependent DNA helicase RecG